MLACLVLAAPAAADDSGGVTAESYDQLDGGILAPAQEPTASGAAVDPVAEPAQEETPTTPEGEEQPEGEENGEQPPTEENGGEETIDPMDLPVDARGGSGGSLPQTGFELAALTAIGLGLLLAGGALWPTSSWPPPRDRLSRSTPRR
jgi:LPXTG-motif cell wall-anchored protein